MGDPITPVMQYGQGGLTFVSVGLFIWSHIRMSKVENASEKMIEATQQMAEIHKEQSAVLLANTEQLLQLTKTMNHSIEITRDLIQRLSEQQSVLAANQLNISQGTQRLMEKLVEALSEKE